MGLSKRKTSGNIINGSTLIVPGQPILSAKKFAITFSNKKGSLPDTHRELPVVPPTQTPTPTPLPTQTPTPVVQVLVYPILINNNEPLIVGDNQYLQY